MCVQFVKQQSYLIWLENGNVYIRQFHKLASSILFKSYANAERGRKVGEIERVKEDGPCALLWFVPKEYWSHTQFHTDTYETRLCNYQDSPKH